MRHPIRACEEFFENGDRVIYKRTEERRWRGPARVIGLLGTVVHLVHGSRLLKYPSNRVTKSDPSKMIAASKDSSTEDKEPAATLKRNSEINVNNEKVDVGTGNLKADEPCQAKDVNNDNKKPNEAEKKADVRRSSRVSVAPVRFVPGDGKGEWHKDVVDEVNVVMIPYDRHSDSSVIAAKKAELTN